jgi:predicted heme/steroid binding protein
LYDGNNEPGTNGQFLVSTGTGVDWQNIAESGLITGSGTNGFISKFTASGVIANSVIQESSSNIGIGISPTQKLHVSGNGLFTGTLTASNVSGSTSGTNTGDENTASIKSKLGLVSAIQDGYLSSVDYESFTNKVPNTRTISINGETFDLSANRTYSVNVGVTSFNARTGAVVLGSGDVTTALGYTPALNSRIMTINGVGYDLSADRTWSVGTVTSVGTSAPLTGGTITSTGTIGITQSGASADGYLSSTDWNTFNNKQAALGFTPENSANKGANNGYASLDGAGKVPSGQLPSYVDDVVEVANYAALPATGETGKIYITLDTNFVYRWSGTVYVKISEPNAVWGSITGTLSNQTDLQSALNAKVDNTRTITINGTASDLSANRTFSVGTVTSVSGTGSVSGLSLSGSVTSSGSLTLGGTLALTSGDVTTGLGYTPVTNARTLSINGTVLDLTANRSWSVGTVTSVGLDLGTAGTDLSVANSPITSSGNITLNIPTASAANRGALSSTDWSTFNSKQNTLTLTTTGSSGASTLVGATLNIPTYTLSGLGGQPLLTNPVTGTGTSGYLTRFTGSTSVGNSVIFDNGTQVGIGTASPSAKLNVSGDIHIGDYGSASSRLLDFRTNNSLFTIATDGTSGGLGTTFTYSWANGGQGPLKFNNASGEVMRLSATGNLGIGTSSPTTGLVVNSRIQITGNTAPSSGTGLELFYDGTGAGSLAFARGTGYIPNFMDGSQLQFFTSSSERMRITSAGNVGIGTTSPSTKLSVVGAANAIAGNIEAPLATSNSVLFGVSDSGAIKAGIGFTKQDGFRRGDLFLFNNDTANDSTNGTASDARLTITSGGNVGIGISSPSKKLQIAGDTGIGVLGVSGNYAVSYFPDTAGNSVFWTKSDGNFTIGTGGNPYSGGLERFRIQASNGYVGIGTSTPGALLDLNSSTENDRLVLSYSSSPKCAFGVSTGGAVFMYHHTSARFPMYISTAGNFGINTTAPTSRLHVEGLPSYADNTTALAGGLTVGAFYHTAGILKVVI